MDHYSWCGLNRICRSTLLICVWQIKFFNTKQFQYCWIAFQLKEIGKLMCYKILSDKNTHLIAWNEILTQFGECDALPNPVCAVAEPVAHAENWPGLPCAPSFINSHTNSTTIRYFFFTQGKLGVPPRVPASGPEPCGGNNADRTTGKLTLQDINTTPKELKTERDVATDSCFSLFGARQYGVTTRENSDEKYPCTLM